MVPLVLGYYSGLFLRGFLYDVKDFWINILSDYAIMADTVSFINSGTGAGPSYYTENSHV